MNKAIELSQILHKDKTHITAFASQVTTEKVLAETIYLKIPVQQNQFAARSYPVQLLSLLLQRFLFQLLDEVYLLEQPNFTTAQAFQVATYVAVNLSFYL